MLWVYRTTDGLFLRDRGGEGLAGNEAVITVPRPPDARAERCTGDGGDPIRAATSTEMGDYDLAQQDAYADRYYKDPDVLAHCYLMLEIEQTAAVFGAKTAGQRRTEVLARAVRYQQARRFISRNYALFAFPV